MELEDRTFSFGTCEREFEKIQQALQGISDDIGQKLSEPKKDSGHKIPDNDELANSEDLNQLLECNEETFALKISKMEVVDLDMAIIVFEQQIKMEETIQREDLQSAKKKLTEMRERLTRCFLKKAELVTCEEGKHSSKCGSRNSANSLILSDKDVNVVEDINCLSISELQSLLFYNGCKYNANDSKDKLVKLVKEHLLDQKGCNNRDGDYDDDEDDGIVDEWEPPDHDQINWTSPEIGDKENESINAGVNNESKSSVPMSGQESEGRTEDLKPKGDGQENNIASARVDANEESRQEVANDTELSPTATSSEMESRQEEKGSLATGGVPKKNKISMGDRAGSYESDPEDDLPAKLEEGSVMDWDPRCLLRDLYFPLQRNKPVDFQKKEANRQVGSNIDKCKMDGYLEKLPINHTKATLLKGWKRRYFKVTQGKLFYFESHLATVPLGSLALTGSQIKVTGDKIIQVQSQSNGNTITLKCSTSNESKDWYHLFKQESAISIPLTAPVKVPLQLEKPTSHVIIIDLGASTIKGGFAGEEKPRVVFPAVYAVSTERKGGRRFTETGIPDPSICTCGFDAFKPEVRRKSKLVYPLRPSLKVDKFSVKSRFIPGFIDEVLKELNVDPSHYTIILSCQRHFTDKDKEFVFDHLFGHLGVSAVYAQQQALLSLFSYKDTTGVIVDIGDHIDVFPVLEGVIIENGSSTFPQGGQLVTEHLSRLLSEGGYRFFSEVESYIVQYIKEKSAFVALDFQGELQSETESLDVDVAKYDLPGQRSTISVGTERFRCAEGLFDPNVWGKDYQGVHKLVEKAIKQSGIDQRREMCRKIFLSGGSTWIEGFPERLQKELKFLMPETVNIQVHGADNRANAAFLGASIISEQPTFNQNLVTKEDWHDYGADIFKRMTQS